MRNVLIFGTGQIAEVMHYYLTVEGGRNVVAFTVDEEYRTAEYLFGLPVVDFEKCQELYPPDSCDMFVAVSFKGVNKARTAKVAEAEAKGYSLTSHVSPAATVWNGFVAEPNTIIMEHNVIQPFVKVGRNVTMWSGNHVGHHTTIQDNCFIASQVVISGACTIGAGTFIGVNATLRDGLTVAPTASIGAGALLLEDAPDNGSTSGLRHPLLRCRALGFAQSDKSLKNGLEAHGPDLQSGRSRLGGKSRPSAYPAAL